MQSQAPSLGGRRRTLPHHLPPLRLTHAAAPPRARRAPAALAAAPPPPPAPAPPSSRAPRRRARRRHLPSPPAAVPPASPDELPAGTAFTRVVAPAAAALALCNIDRICLSVAIVPIAAQFSWGPAVQGLVQSAFLWGYTATQFAGGRLADAVGGRTVLAAGIAFFSLAQAATAAALGSSALAAAGLTLPAVLAARAAVGLGEGVALPSVTALITAHVPPGARASALGATFAGFHGGNLLGLLASPPLLAAAGWRGLFYVAAGCGVPLLGAWLALVPRRVGRRNGGVAGRAAAAGKAAPAAAAAAAAAAPTTTTPTTTPSSPLPPPTIPNFLRSRAVWAIIAANVANHWGYFVFLNWLPSFFAGALGTDLRASAAWSVAPWAAMAGGAALSGLVGDWAVSGGVPVREVRRRVQVAAFGVPAVALAVLASLSGGGGVAGAAAAAAAAPSPLLTPPLACALVTLALGAASLGQFVTNMGDVAPTAAGSLFGLCNTFGCAAGGAGVAGAGALVQASGGSFASVFGVTAGLYVAGAAVFWAWAQGDAQFA